MLTSLGCSHPNLLFVKKNNFNMFRMFRDHLSPHLVSDFVAIGSPMGTNSPIWVLHGVPCGPHRSRAGGGCPHFFYSPTLENNGRNESEC